MWNGSLWKTCHPDDERIDIWIYNTLSPSCYPSIIWILLIICVCVYNIVCLIPFLISLSLETYYRAGVIWNWVLLSAMSTCCCQEIEVHFIIESCWEWIHINIIFRCTIRSAMKISNSELNDLDIVGSVSNFANVLLRSRINEIDEIARSGACIWVIKCIVLPIGLALRSNFHAVLDNLDSCIITLRSFCICINVIQKQSIASLKNLSIHIVAPTEAKCPIHPVMTFYVFYCEVLRKVQVATIT